MQRMCSRLLPSYCLIVIITITIITSGRYSTTGSSTCTIDNNVYQCNLASTTKRGSVEHIPFYLMAPFACIGGGIYYIRLSNSNLSTLSISSIILNILLLEVDFTSDAIFVILLLRGSFLKFSGNEYLNNKPFLH